MPAPNPITTLRLPSTIRRHLDVATAGAWEALTDAHADEALRLIGLVADDWSFDESLDYYFAEMGITGSLATGVRNRVLVRMEEQERLDVDRPSLHMTRGEDEAGNGATPGWKRFRPDHLVRQMRARQQRAGETGRWANLAIAQAEEAILAVHVDNALDFVALLEEHLSLERAVSYYVDAIGLSSCRAQAVVQRSMARLADALIEPHEPPKGGVAR